MHKASGVGIIGIAGPTCSRKTTLAAELQSRLTGSCNTLSFDEYDLFPTGSEAMERELREPTITNWEDPSLFDMEAFVADLGKIAMGQPVELQTRSRESMNRGETTRIYEPAALNIVEGLFVLRDRRARALMDLTVYLDLPIEHMVQRRLEASRGGEGPWDDPDYIRGPMAEGTRKYVIPQHRWANLRLNAFLPTNALADDVMCRLNRL